MKQSTLSALSLLLASILLFSCTKDNHPGTPPPTTGTMTINFSALQSSLLYELIISDTGGKILLDTTTNFSSPFTAVLKTNHTFLDVTTIFYNTFDSTYGVNIYKSVNPSTWTSILPTDYSVPIPPLSGTTASVVYVNVPPLSYNDLTVTDYFGSYSNSTFNLTPTSFDLTYTKYSNSNYVYTVFPQSGRYNFHIPPASADTVDLSHIDTAVVLTFNKPAGFTMQNSFLVGFLDTTDFSKSVWLFNDMGLTGLPDMVYPTKLVQEYELYSSATNGNNGTGFYYSYADSVPSTLPFPTPSSYTISSSQANNFAVKFNSTTPTIYATSWRTSKVEFSYNAPGDSTNLNPQGFLTSLNSKMLQGQDLSGLSITSFYIQNIQGFDYNGFTSYQFNPALVKTQRIHTLSSYSQSF
jgi:hypothetical protein